MDVITLLITYFAAMNLIGLFLMGLDKHKAKKHLWRIPESTLFITAIIGGSIGCIIGMYAFRHKTRRWYRLRNAGHSCLADSPVHRPAARAVPNPDYVDDRITGQGIFSPRPPRGVRAAQQLISLRTPVLSLQSSIISSRLPRRHSHTCC